MQNSIVGSVLWWLWGVLSESMIFRGILAIGSAILRAFRESVPGRFLCREKTVDEYTEGSVFYKLIEAVWSFVRRVFGMLTDGIRRLGEGGLCCRFFRSPAKDSFLLHTGTILGIGVCAIFIVPHDYWNNIFGLLIAGGLAFLYFGAVLVRNRKMGTRASGIWVSFLFFVFVTGMSILGSPTLSDSIRTLMFFVTSFILCLVIYGTLTTAGRMEMLLRFLVIALFVTSAIAIVQRLMGIESDASLTDLELNKGMPGRVFGTLGNPNNFAEFLMLILPLSFAWSLNEQRIGRKYIGFFVTILGAAALILTYSRSGWIAFAVAVLVFVALYNRRFLPVLMILGVCMIPLLPETVLNRILTIGNLKDSSSSYRIDIWRGSIRMLKDGYWLRGVGLGSGAFQSVYPPYAIGASGIAPHTHMQFMEILTEMGILGLVSLLWYSFGLIRRAAVWSQKGIEKELRTVLCACASSMAGITFIGFVEYTWFYPRVMLAFFIVAGIAMAAVRNAKEQGIK